MGAIAVGKTVIDAVKSGVQYVSDLKEQLGTLDDEIIVTVAGGPLSNKRQLYKLAAAVAFGVVKRLVPAGDPLNPFAAPGSLGIEYDATTKEVTLILRLRRTLFAITAPVALGGAGQASALSQTAVFSGPDDFVVGGAWDFALNAGILGVKMPTLEFAGKTILTDSPVVQSPDPRLPAGASRVIDTPNPRPSGDARSRGSLCWMVWQALANPAEGPEGSGTHSYVLPNDANRFSGG